MTLDRVEAVLQVVPEVEAVGGAQQQALELDADVGVALVDQVAELAGVIGGGDGAERAADADGCGAVDLVERADRAAQHRLGVATGGGRRDRRGGHDGAVLVADCSGTSPSASVRPYACEARNAPRVRLRRSEGRREGNMRVRTC